MCIRDRISSTQIEAARVAMARYIKRGGKVWIKIFPDKPVTEKPAETLSLIHIYRELYVRSVQSLAVCRRPQSVL